MIQQPEAAPPSNEKEQDVDSPLTAAEREVAALREQVEELQADASTGGEFPSTWRELYALALEKIGSGLVSNRGRESRPDSCHKTGGRYA